jgi:hypothetical protein
VIGNWLKRIHTGSIIQCLSISKPSLQFKNLPSSVRLIALFHSRAALFDIPQLMPDRADIGARGGPALGRVASGLIFIP